MCQKKGKRETQIKSQMCVKLTFGLVDLWMFAIYKDKLLCYSSCWAKMVSQVVLHPAPWTVAMETMQKTFQHLVGRKQTIPKLQKLSRFLLLPLRCLVFNITTYSRNQDVWGAAMFLAVSPNPFVFFGPAILVGTTGQCCCFVRLMMQYLWLLWRQRVCTVHLNASVSGDMKWRRGNMKAPPPPMCQAERFRTR